jgi:hypothetical protein
MHPMDVVTYPILQLRGKSSIHKTSSRVGDNTYPNYRMTRPPRVQDVSCQIEVCARLFPYNYEWQPQVTTVAHCQDGLILASEKGYIAFLTLVDAMSKESAANINAALFHIYEHY